MTNHMTMLGLTRYEEVQLCLVFRPGEAATTQGVMNPEMLYV